MSVKKLFDLIFEPVDEEEEEEVVVDKPLKRYEFKEENKEKKVTSKVVPASDVASDELIRAKKEEIKKKDVLDKRTFSKYDISASSTPKRVQVQMNAQRKVEPIKPIKYVSQPTISPIYGIIESKETTKKGEGPKFVQRSSTKSPIGTVLSPIYGVISDAKGEKEIIEKEKVSAEKVVAQSNVEPLSDNFDDIQLNLRKDYREEIRVGAQIAEEINSETPVSDILAKPSEDEAYITNDDISLFDDLGE